MDKEIVKETYQKMSSEELIKIVQNIKDDYEEEAVKIAKAELRGRDITEIPKPEIPQNPPTPEFYLSQSRVIRNYLNELEADMARIKLESENIQAFIWKDDCGGWRPWLQPITGVRLVVREDEADDANEILRQFESDSTT